MKFYSFFYGLMNNNLRGLTIDGNLIVGGDLNVSGNVSIGGNVNINGTVRIMEIINDEASLIFTEKTIRINKNRNVYIQKLDDEIIICISESNCFDVLKQKIRRQLIDELNKFFGIPPNVDLRPLFINGGILFKEGWEEINKLNLHP